MGPYDSIAIDWEKGPVRWMAAESLRSPHIFSRASDVWSYGATMHEIYSMGKKPYNHLHRIESVRDLVLGGVVMDFPVHLPHSLESLYNSCFNSNPDNRPTMTDVLCRLEDECNNTL